MPLHRIDVRVTKVIPVRGQIRISAIAEIFNLFDRANYGAYNGQVNSLTFGQSVRALVNAYRSRTVQLAFRAQF